MLACTPLAPVSGFVWAESLEEGSKACWQLSGDMRALFTQLWICIATRVGVHKDKAVIEYNQTEQEERRTLRNLYSCQAQRCERHQLLLKSNQIRITGVHAVKIMANTNTSLKCWLKKVQLGQSAIIITGLFSSMRMSINRKLFTRDTIFPCGQNRRLVAFQHNGRDARLTVRVFKERDDGEGGMVNKK